MSELKWLYVIKIDDTIQFKTSLEPDYLQTQYSILTTCIVKDVDSKICVNCQINELKNIKEGEIWICFNNEYFCHSCFPKVKQSLEFFLKNQENLKKKVPRKIKDVICDIERHEQYVNLDVFIRYQYEACRDKLTNTTTDNNKYLKALWFHLYHNKEMPIG